MMQTKMVYLSRADFKGTFPSLIEGAQAGELGIEGWYAPAANMHRTSFGGRNYEYYSEDEFISGMMAAKTVEGSLDAGGDLWMDGFVMGDFTYETESNSFKQELRRACKNILLDKRKHSKKKALNFLTIVVQNVSIKSVF